MNVYIEELDNHLALIHSKKPDHVNTLEINIDEIPREPGILKIHNKKIWVEPYDISNDIKRLLNDISKTCEKKIDEGFSIETDSGIEHFSLTDRDKSHLTAAIDAINKGSLKYPYHANGKLCRMYSAKEIKNISDAAIFHVLYHTTYCNHMFRWIENSKNLDDLNKIYYGASLPKELKTNMDNILKETTNGRILIDEETGIYIVNITT